ncbi:MAG: hypothetical protein OXE40_13615 [Gammaproteobacteria bacterium]|nr:hypothetical protein [Gammaproteobacteria bacterium]
MLSHWLIALPRNRRANYQVPGRVRAAIAQHLYYKPDQVLFHRHDTGAWTLSVSANTRSWGIEAPFALNDDSFVAVAGVPTLEAISDAEASVPEKLAACVRRQGSQYVFANVGGTFSLGMLSPQGVSAFADFSGYSSCFYLDTDDFFAVGNLPGLVGALRPGFPARHEVDTPTLCWIAATTMVMGDRTPFAGVRRLRTGHRIEVTLGREPFAVGSADIAPFSPMHFDRPDKVNSFEAIDYGRCVQTMKKRLGWCRDQGIEFRSHLTGGRDTRAISAILAKSGHLDGVTQFTTNGSDTNGDVLVARELAPALGIADRHAVRHGTKAAAELDAPRFVDALARSAFVFAGQLTPYDGRPEPANMCADYAIIMGGGGEIYRQEWGPPAILEGPGAAVKALNLFARYDRLKILSDECRDFHESVLDGELRYLKDREVVNLTCAFYLEARLANWGCAHFSNSTSTQFPLLLDFELARCVLGLEDVAEHIHFEIMRHCDENLLRIPFLNNRWAAPTEARARELGFPTRPMNVDVERNFPWQFHGYRRYRNELVAFCLDHGDCLRGVVSREKLEALGQLPVEPFSSASVKMLYGLVGAIFFAERAYMRTRDFAGAALPRFSGNATGAKFRDICGYGNWRAGSSLRDDLVERIRAA